MPIQHEVTNTTAAPLVSRLGASAPHAPDRLLARHGGWAVVTGASDGIGRAFATELTARGFPVVLVARREGVLRELAAQLTATSGVPCEVIVADLGSAAGIGEVVERTASLDVGLFIAAAGFGTSGSFLETDVDVELALVDVNVRAVTALAHVFARRMARRGRGGIVLMSSLVAFQGVPRSANYAASKAYVQSLAEALHVELRGHGVDVLACAPGPVRSGFGARANMVMGGDEPKAVVGATLRQLGRRTTVRPGLLGFLLGVSLSMLPRFGRVWVMTRVMKGMTAHHA